MNSQKPTAPKYKKYLYALFVVSFFCGIILLMINRNLYNTWFLGLHSGQWPLLPTGIISMAELKGYWNWSPGRMLILSCVAAWVVALGSGAWLSGAAIISKR